MNPICVGCQKRPEELVEFIEMGELEEMSPSDYVRSEEGTYNPENGHFLCTDCYVDAGMPQTPGGWVCP